MKIFTLVFIALVIFIIGCTSSNPEISDNVVNTENINSQPNPTCSLITDQDMASVCGYAGVTHEINSVAGCSYKNSNGGLAPAVYYAIPIKTPNEYKLEFKKEGAALLEAKYENVPGLGDEAIIIKHISVVRELVAKKGQESLVIVGGSDYCNGEEGLKQLAKIALDKL